MRVPSEMSQGSQHALARHSYPEHQCHGQGRQDHHHGHVECRVNGGAIVRCQPVAECRPEPGDKGGLAAERSNHLHTAQRLLEVGILQADSLAARPFGVSDTYLEISGHQHHRHHRQRRHQRQQRAEGNHRHGNGAQPDHTHQYRGPARPTGSASRGCHRPGHCRGEERRHGFHIRRAAADGIPQRGAIIIAQW